MDIPSLEKRLSFRRPSKMSLVSGNKVVAKELFGAKDPSQQARGLMFRKLKPKQALLFFMPLPQRFSLHMLFVFHSIDVLFCDVSDKGFVIKEVKRGFRPFTTYRARHRSAMFIELPAGGAVGLRKGDLLVPKDI